MYCNIQTAILWPMKLCVCGGHLVNSVIHTILSHLIGQQFIMLVFCFLAQYSVSYIWHIYINW